MRNLERLLETWMGEEEGKRMKSLIVRLAKDESGNNLLHFSESESEDSGKENEKNWKKLRAEKRSAGSWWSDVEEGEYHYRLERLAEGKF